MENDDYAFDEDVTFYETSSRKPHGMRFGEGQPINRRGRPRGSPNVATMVKRIAMKKQRVTIDGRVRRKSSMELVALAVRLKASQGDPKAFKIMEDLLLATAAKSIRPIGVLFAAEEPTGEEWEAVYGPHLSDEYVEEHYPYMMRARRRNQTYNAEIERQTRLNEAVYEARRKNPV